MRDQLISAGLSVLLFCCSSESGTANGAGGTASSSGGASGAATMTGGGGVGAGSSSVAGASASGGSTGASGSVSGGATSSSGGATSGGAATGGAGAAAGGAGTGGTAATGACSRTDLQAAVDAYKAAQTAGDKSKMPLASSVKYTENFKSVTTGIWDTALNIAFQRDFLDTTVCQTFSEVFVPEGDTQYVLGIRLALTGSQIGEIESIVTKGTVSGSTITSNDWNFDAKAYMTCSKSEDWSVVPEASRSSRDELIAAGEAYFKVFSDKETMVPWGMPCFRLEGGKGCTPAQAMASKTCNVGVPDGITFKNTHWVVDLELNTAIGMTLFAGAAPDSHMFRLIDGTIRKVHTLTQGTGNGSP